VNFVSEESSNFCITRDDSPVPLAYYTFGGWKRSAFGDLIQHGPDSIRFYTKTKTVTSLWPSGVKKGTSFIVPLM
jgi:malonate-semialdehyde dehydrogenase (acetylating)/methylmalonate-semialdehyde dehydrogenase